MDHTDKFIGWLMAHNEALVSLIMSTGKQAAFREHLITEREKGVSNLLGMPVSDDWSVGWQQGMDLLISRLVGKGPADLPAPPDQPASGD